MTIEDFLSKVKSNPGAVEFTETIALIDSAYTFNPCSFINGTLVNEAGQNNGSCKIFSFAQIHGLSESDTLALFGHFYRNDVLNNAHGTDHQNIRNFMKTGWGGIKFSGHALVKINLMQSEHTTETR